MPGPLLTLRALGGSNSTSTDIVTDARYQLARPDLVNGVPSLSLVSSNQACTVRTYIDGVFNTSLTVATTGSIPMLKASGAMLSAVELAALTFDVSGLQYAEVLHVTDEPAGSPGSPFTSTAERDAVMPAGVPRRECYVLNEFAPLAPGVPGLVKWIDNGAAWVLAPNQVVAKYRNFDGSPLRDLIATALTPGTGAEVWASPAESPLPDWMFTDNSCIATHADYAILDTVSTAAASAVLRISQYAYTGSLDASYGLSSVSVPAMSPTPSGPQQMFSEWLIRSGSIYGAGGGRQTPPCLAQRSVCTPGPLATRRARLSLSPASANTRIVLYSFTIMSR